MQTELGFFNLSSSLLEGNFGIWVYRANGKIYEFVKLAVYLPDKRFEFTGGFFGQRPEVRPKE